LCPDRPDELLDDRSQVTGLWLLLFLERRDQIADPRNQVGGASGGLLDPFGVVRRVAIDFVGQGLGEATDDLEIVAGVVPAADRTARSVPSWFRGHAGLVPAVRAIGCC
jgi:hypothetical protein